MKSYTYPVSAAALVVVVLVGFQLASRAKTTHALPPAAAADDSEIEDLKRQLQTLQSEVRANSLRTRTIEANQATAQVRDDPTGQGSNHDTSREPLETKDEAERKREVYMAKVEQGFHNELPDRDWGPTVAKKIDEVLHAQDIGLNPKSFECRSSSCRVELPWDVTGGLQKNLPLFLNRMGEQLASTVAHQVDDGQGGQNTVVFMFRGAAPSAGQ